MPYAPLNAFISSFSERGDEHNAQFIGGQPTKQEVVCLPVTMVFLVVEKSLVESQDANAPFPFVAGARNVHAHKWDEHCVNTALVDESSGFWFREHVLPQMRTRRRVVHGGIASLP